MAIDESELKDFSATLKERGLAERQFEVASTEHPVPAHGLSPVTGAVTVRNKKTGAEQTYEAGHGTAWVAKFAEDLDAGHFA